MVARRSGDARCASAGGRGAVRALGGLDAGGGRLGQRRNPGRMASGRGPCRRDRSGGRGPGRAVGANLPVDRAVDAGLARSASAVDDLVATGAGGCGQRRDVWRPVHADSGAGGSGLPQPAAAPMAGGGARAGRRHPGSAAVRSGADPDRKFRWQRAVSVALAEQSPDAAQLRPRRRAGAGAGVDRGIRSGVCIWRAALRSRVPGRRRGRCRGGLDGAPHCAFARPAAMPGHRPRLPVCRADGRRRGRHAGLVLRCRAAADRGRQAAALRADPWPRRRPAGLRLCHLSPVQPLGRH